MHWRLKLGGPVFDQIGEDKMEQFQRTIDEAGESGGEMCR